VPQGVFRLRLFPNASAVCRDIRKRNSKRNKEETVFAFLGTAGEKTGSLPVSPRGEVFSKGVTRAFIFV
jgi:hypothetical protein